MNRRTRSALPVAAAYGSEKLRITFLALLLVIPITSNLLHGDGLRELGLRFDNLWRSAFEVGIASVGLAAPIVAVAALARRGLDLRLGSGAALVLYPVWAFLQQYALQAFAYRRLREGLGRPGRAASIAALIFAVVHLPNAILVGCTMIAAYVWCRLYERAPNLFTLAVAHGWLAVLLNVSWPQTWLHTLRVGPGYWASP